MASWISSSMHPLDTLINLAEIEEINSSKATVLLRPVGLLPPFNLITQSFAAINCHSHSQLPASAS